MVQLIPQESLADMLGAQIGNQVGAGIQSGIGSAIQQYQKEKEIERNEKNLINRGYPTQLARLAATATTGGHTEILKYLLEQEKRGQNSSLDNQIKDEEVPDEQNLESFIKEGNKGLTASEKVRRESERFKSGLPVYQEATTKLRNSQRDRERISILEKLNETKKLPQNLGRINVSPEGNLRLPFASTPEAERYVKTLNEFTSGAKDSFGSRVTNFDLQQYLLRFPTLLNSDEGRRQLLKQMTVFSKINDVYYRNLKKVYDKAGGVRKIDADIASGLAEQLSEKEVSNLVQQFDEIQSETKETPENRPSLEEIFK